ncbi:MAG: hypothetical protein M1827_001186 [Pycnora praestabilis]|nr:MAG: hypothetical protein M1827_001186 [Pycnora praestabilis]
MAPPMVDDTDALLSRLSQKPGVQSTLILSRATGSIVRTSGLISSSASPNPDSTLPTSPSMNAMNHESSADSTNGVQEPREGDREVGSAGGSRSAEEVAKMVWNFIGAAGGLVEGLDAEDEVKLLRLRTRKNELVIVPGEVP